VAHAGEELALGLVGALGLFLGRDQLEALALGLAIETVVRPLPLLPPEALAEDAFVAALRLAEAESGRLLQPNLRLLKAMVPATPREALEEAVESRRAGVAALWADLLDALSD